MPFHRALNLWRHPTVGRRGRLLAVLGLGCALMGVKGVDQAATSDQLDYMIIEVNGRKSQVMAGEELAVVKGDVVKILAARARDPERKISNVNFVGYAHPEAERVAEDRQYAIDTARDLRQRWSRQKRGEVYEIRAASGPVKHGRVFIRLLTPALKYAVLTIDGKTRMLRDGELARLHADDSVKVTKVVTNIEDDQKNISFQIVPSKGEQVIPGMDVFEVRFSWKDAVFARIPLLIEGRKPAN